MLIGGAAFLAISVVVVGVNVIANLPKKVEIRLAIQDTNGGVFDQECNVTAIAVSQVPTALRVRESGSDESTPGTQLTYFVDPKGGCIGKAEVELNPTKRYEILDGETSLGVIGTAEFNSAVADAAKTVEVTRAFEVNFALYDDADYCTGTASNWQCYWNDNYFGLDFDSNDNCSGQNGFSDIHEGTTVTVTGISNGRSHTEAFIGNSYDVTSVSSAQMYCTFYANFENLPNDDGGFSVEVGN